uniref:Autotransporter domain-containing protein n=1 Tax=Bursaphelenchus xylophilus TaxID=6326 RepID=A0A1I7RI92_BURXY
MINKSAVNGRVFMRSEVILELEMAILVMPKSEWAKWKATFASNYKAIIVSACAAYALVALASSMSRAHTVTSTHRPQIIRDLSNRNEISEDTKRIDKTTAIGDENGSYKDSRVVESSDNLTPSRSPEAINVEDLKPSTPDVEFSISTTPYNHGIDVLSEKEGQETASSDSTTDKDSTTTAATENEKLFDDFKGETKPSSTVSSEGLKGKSGSKTTVAETTKDSESSTLSTLFSDGLITEKSTTEKEDSTDGQGEDKLATTGNSDVIGSSSKSSVDSESSKSSSKTTLSPIPEAEEEEITKKEEKEGENGFIGNAEQTTASTSKASESTAKGGRYIATKSTSEASTSQDDIKFSTRTGSTSEKISDDVTETTTVQTLESSTSTNAESPAVSEKTVSEETTTSIDQNLEVIVIDDIKKKIEKNETPSPVIDNKNTGKLITELGGGNNRAIEEVPKTSGNSENIGIADSVDISGTEVNGTKNNDDINFGLQKGEEKRDGPATDF